MRRLLALLPARARQSIYELRRRGWARSIGYPVVRWAGIRGPQG